jgi:hypothetical protein
VVFAIGRLPTTRDPRNDCSKQSAPNQSPRLIADHCSVNPATLLKKRCPRRLSPKRHSEMIRAPDMPFRRSRSKQQAKRPARSQNLPDGAPDQRSSESNRGHEPMRCRRKFGGEKAVPKCWCCCWGRVSVIDADPVSAEHNCFRVEPRYAHDGTRKRARPASRRGTNSYSPKGGVNPIAVQCFSPWAGTVWKRILSQRPEPLQLSAAYYRKILSLPPTARLVSGASPVICFLVPRGSACWVSLRAAAWASLGSP